MCYVYDMFGVVGFAAFICVYGSFGSMAVLEALALERIGGLVFGGFFGVEVTHICMTTIKWNIS